MAKTLLNGVNDILNKAAAIDSGSTLSSLTDNSRQTWVDLAVTTLNEVIDELFSIGHGTKPKQMKEATVTLVAAQQSYSLKSTLLRLRREYHLIDETNNHQIYILGDDGYHSLVLGDLEQDDTGLPSWAAISPVDGKLWFDRAPTADHAGRIYKYRYDREFQLDTATDVLPFGDAVYRAIISAAAELWKMNRHQDFSADIFAISLGRAARLLSQYPPTDTWSQSAGSNPTDPMQR